MNKLAKIKSEWEKSLLFAVIGLFGLGLIIWFWPGNNEGSVKQPTILPKKPDFVDLDSDFWLRPTFPEGKISILAFSRTLPPPPATTTTESGSSYRPQPGTGGTGGASSTGRPSQATNSTVPEPKTKPTPPPRIISISYRGMYQGLSEQKLAFIKASDSSSKRSLNAPLAAGERIFALFTVVSFDEHSLTIMFGEGKSVVIDRGSEKKVKL